jgi:hypothetical protein
VFRNELKQWIGQDSRNERDKVSKLTFEDESEIKHKQYKEAGSKGKSGQEREIKIKPHKGSKQSRNEPTTSIGTGALARSCSLLVSPLDLASQTMLNQLSCINMLGLSHLHSACFSFRSFLSKIQPANMKALEDSTCKEGTGVSKTSSVKDTIPDMSDN